MPKDIRVLLAAYNDGSSDSSSSQSNVASCHFSDISEASNHVAAVSTDGVADNVPAPDLLQTAMAAADITLPGNDRQPSDQASLTDRPDVFTGLDPMIGQLYDWLTPSMPESAAALKQLATQFSIMDKQSHTQAQELARLHKTTEAEAEKMRCLNAYVKGVEDVHQWTIAEIIKCTPKCKLEASELAVKGEKRVASEASTTTKRQHPVASDSNEHADIGDDDRYKGKVVYMTGTSGDRVAAVMVVRCQAPGCNWFERPLGSIKISTHWRQRHASELGPFDRGNSNHMVREIMMLTDLDSQ